MQLTFLQALPCFCRWALLVGALAPFLADAQELTLNIGRGDSDPTWLEAGAATVHFSAYTGTGYAVHEYDTITGVGTVIDSPPFLDPPAQLTVVGNKLFFSGEAAGEREGVELWVAESGVATRIDIRPGSTLNPALGSFTAYDGLLIFTADDGVHGREAWRSNGTQAGTYMLEDISLAGDSIPAFFEEANGLIFFAATSDYFGRELWKTDGSSSGTMMVTDIDPIYSSNPRQFERLGNTLFFSADDGLNGREMWKSNGTTTVLVSDLEPGPGDSEPVGLTRHAGWVYFVAATSAHGDDLFRTGGFGVEALETIVGPGSVSPSLLTSSGTRLYFTGEDATHGRELWSTDGTPGGAAMVKDINAGPGTSHIRTPTDVVGTLHFEVYIDGVTDLWRSDGTASGTYEILDTWGNGPNEPDGLTAHGGELYFAADNGTDVGRELWRTDESTGIAEFAWDAYSVLGSNPTDFRPWQPTFLSPDYLLTYADLPGDGRELCLMLNPIVYSDPEVMPQGWGSRSLTGAIPGAEFVVNGEYLYYTVWGETEGSEARMVWYISSDFDEYSQTIIPGPTGSQPAGLTIFDGECLFTARGSTSPDDFGLYRMGRWGPTLIRSFGPERPRGIVALDDRPTGLDVALFTGHQPATGWELWATDNVDAVLFVDIEPGVGSSDPQQLVRAGNRVFFTAFRSDVGRELWTSDGTPAGTMLLADLEPGPAGSEPEELVASGSRVFFTATTTDGGRELYYATGGSVVALGELVIGPGSADPRGLAAVAGDLYFTADPGDGTGREPWLYDDVSMRMLADISSGPTSSECGEFLEHNYLCYFVAENATFGREIWRTNGDLYEVVSDDASPGPWSLRPGELTHFRDWVVYAATTSHQGREIWYLEDAGILDVEGEMSAVSSPFPVLAPGQIRVGPNPVHDVATIRVRTGSAGHATARLIDASGRETARRELGELDAGPHAVRWDVRADRLSPGVYFIEVEVGAERMSGKFVLMP